MLFIYLLFIGKTVISVLAVGDDERDVGDYELTCSRVVRRLPREGEARESSC